MKQIKIENNGVEQLITVPENSKVTIDGNVVVFEPKFKKGDVISDGNWLLVYESDCGSNDCNHFVAYNKKSNFIDFGCSFGGFINPKLSSASEKQLLFDALAKEGKQWNAEKLCIEDLKVVPKVGDCVKLYFKDKYIAYFVCKENGKFTPKKSFLCNVLENGYTITKTNLELDYNGNCEYDIQEEQQFKYELAQLGFEYNFENDTISELTWKPKNGDTIYFIDCDFSVDNDTFDGLSSLDIRMYECGNTFKTSELCQQAIDKIKQVLSEK